MRRADSFEDSDAGKDWTQEEKGMTDEIVGWHHQLNGHEFEQALRVGDVFPWAPKSLYYTIASWLKLLLFTLVSLELHFSHFPIFLTSELLSHCEKKNHIFWQDKKNFNTKNFPCLLASSFHPTLCIVHQYFSSTKYPPLAEIPAQP